jgi:hypothetical protein
MFLPELPIFVQVNQNPNKLASFSKKDAKIKMINLPNFFNHVMQAWSEACVDLMSTIPKSLETVPKLVITY